MSSRYPKTFVVGADLNKNDMVKISGKGELLPERVRSKLEPPAWVIGFVNRACVAGEEIRLDEIDLLRKRPGRGVKGDHGARKTRRGWKSGDRYQPAALDPTAPHHNPLLRAVEMQNRVRKNRPDTTPPATVETGGVVDTRCPRCGAFASASFAHRPTGVESLFHCVDKGVCTWWFVARTPYEKQIHAQRYRSQRRGFRHRLARKKKQEEREAKKLETGIRKARKQMEQLERAIARTKKGQKHGTE